MKVMSIISAMVMLLSLTGAGCSFVYEKSGPSAAANSNKAPASAGDLVSEATHLSWGYTQKPLAMARLSRQLGMVTLKDTKLADSDSEIRVWYGFGLIAPMCLVLKIQGGGAAAYYVGPKVANDRGVLDRNGELVYVKTDLGAPRSGWEEVINYLRSEGVELPLKLSLDTSIKSYPDQGHIVIEAKTGAQYGFVYYAEGTTSQDGLKAFKIRRRLAEEFGRE